MSYKDPKTTHIEDWPWAPLEDVQSKIDLTEVPDYILKGYGEFMKHQAARAAAGQLTPREVLKAYGITMSSIGRVGLPHATATKAGLKLPNTGGEVRPEGAFAEWLLSPMGQRYLNAAEKGNAHEKALQDIQTKFNPFGKQNQLAVQLHGAARTIPGMTPEINRTVPLGREDYRPVAEAMKGVGPAKSGFVGSMLGMGDLPTLDARQLELHAPGPGPTKSKTGILDRGKKMAGREAVDRLAARQIAMQLKLDPEFAKFYQHLAHHAVWDKTEGTQTTHADIVNAMKNAKAGGGIGMAKGGEQPVAPVLASKALDPYLNETLGATITDWSRAQKGNTDLQGGPYFTAYGIPGHELYKPENEGKVWGNKTLSAAGRIRGEAKSNPGLIMTTMLGTPNMHRSSDAVASRVFNAWKKAIAEGSLTEDLRQTMNQALQKNYLYKEGKEKGQSIFEPDIDVGSKDFLKRLHTFQRRAAAMEVLGGKGVGGKKGQIFPYDKIIKDTTDPRLVKAEAKTGDIGPFLWQPSNEPLTVSKELNKAYPVITSGKVVGEMPLTPRDALFYDFIKKVEKAKGRKVTAMDWLMNNLSQKMTPEFFHRLEDKGYAEGGSVPSEPGSTPIKEGHVRLYHQTDEDNLREIEKHGLLLKHAKGIEGPRAIYAGETPFYGDPTDRPTLEFQVPKEYWDAPFVLKDVHPKDFISAHYPWHRHARYLEDESGIKNVLSGRFDTLKGNEGKAVEYIRNKYLINKANSDSKVQRINEIGKYQGHIKKLTGKAEGGPVGLTDMIQKKPQPSMDEMQAALTLRKSGKRIDISSIGANEAPDLPVKAYSPPGPGQLPVGGVDLSNIPGQQLMPQDPQQAQQGQPGQQPPQGPQAAPQGPQGAPQGPQSNILQMTPQGQAMAAMTPPPQPDQPDGSQPQGMADGGATKPVYTHEVYDIKTGDVKGKYQTANAARRGVDRYDNQYGGYRHHYRPIGEPQKKAHGGRTVAQMRLELMKPRAPRPLHSDDLIVEEHKL
jgi:hypothetical protein